MIDLPVIQADRNATANRLNPRFDSSPIATTQSMIRSGKLDGHA